MRRTKPLKIRCIYDGKKAVAEKKQNNLKTKCSVKITIKKAITKKLQNVLQKYNII